MNDFECVAALSLQYQQTSQIDTLEKTQLGIQTIQSLSLSSLF